MVKRLDEPRDPTTAPPSDLHSKGRDLARDGRAGNPPARSDTQAERVARRQRTLTTGPGAGARRDPRHPPLGPGRGGGTNGTGTFSSFGSSFTDSFLPSST